MFDGVGEALAILRKRNGLGTQGQAGMLAGMSAQRLNEKLIETCTQQSLQGRGLIEAA
jgi:hypothetical protein